jgi:hypothetical protein
LAPCGHPPRVPAPQQPLRDPLLEGLTQVARPSVWPRPLYHEPITLSEPYSTGAADYEDFPPVTDHLRPGRRIGG